MFAVMYKKHLTTTTGRGTVITSFKSHNNSVAIETRYPGGVSVDSLINHEIQSKAFLNIINSDGTTIRGSESVSMINIMSFISGAVIGAILVSGFLW